MKEVHSAVESVVILLLNTDRGSVLYLAAGILSVLIHVSKVLIVAEVKTIAKVTEVQGDVHHPSFWLEGHVPIFTLLYFLRQPRHTESASWCWREEIKLKELKNVGFDDFSG